MTALLVDDLAQFIRREDGRCCRPPYVVGDLVADFLDERGIHEARRLALAEFVERTNPDKRMGAGRLAELIVAEFRLDEEN